MQVEAKKALMAKHKTKSAVEMVLALVATLAPALLEVVPALLPQGSSPSLSSSSPSSSSLFTDADNVPKTSLSSSLFLRTLVSEESTDLSFSSFLLFERALSNGQMGKPALMSRAQRAAMAGPREQFV